MAIIDFAQQLNIKPISKNNIAIYAQLEQETEEVELKKLLGVALLQDLQANPTTPENLELLDGAAFQDCNGNTIIHKGIRYVLAYLVHSRYVDNSGIEDTFTGFQNQDRNETRRLSDGNKTNFQRQSREIALSEFEIIRDFLNENKAAYPLWMCETKTSIYTPKFSGVRKTRR